MNEILMHRTYELHKTSTDEERSSFLNLQGHKVLWFWNDRILQKLKMW